MLLLSSAQPVSKYSIEPKATWPQHLRLIYRFGPSNLVTLTEHLWTSQWHRQSSANLSVGRVGAAWFEERSTGSFTPSAQYLVDPMTLEFRRLERTGRGTSSIELTFGSSATATNTKHLSSNRMGGTLSTLSCCHSSQKTVGFGRVKSLSTHLRSLEHGLLGTLATVFHCCLQVTNSSRTLSLVRTLWSNLPSLTNLTRSEAKTVQSRVQAYSLLHHSSLRSSINLSASAPWSSLLAHYFTIFPEKNWAFSQ